MGFHNSSTDAKRQSYGFYLEEIPTLQQQKNGLSSKTFSFYTTTKKVYQAFQLPVP